MRKEEIRSRIKARKAILTDAERRSAAEAVFSVLENSVAFMMAENILLYHSLPDELSTRGFIEKWHSRKNFFLPRVNGVNLEVLPYDRSSLRLGAFQIEEPEGDDVRDISSIELIVVPGVAYDRRGNRVGRGKGYYDRMLASTRATKVGVGYDFQLVDDIDADPHDVTMDLVVTEHEVVRVRRR
ncbi:5-formyltetrahydrofolate cyclo-ligase [uncultured Muribaculum sp.]|uniref:5-formyltetrahydrofolate cyclo-ligase n=1 Tax=uncultured Muribaculum sp. TaxID=1918613 RepID=UPI0025D50F52|nr:5-formyltetrahydrofolate cyclo-ligase [uncultured Muribaculum sp.]